MTLCALLHMVSFQLTHLKVSDCQPVFVVIFSLHFFMPTHIGRSREIAGVNKKPLRKTQFSAQAFCVNRMPYKSSDILHHWESMSNLCLPMISPGLVHRWTSYSTSVSESCAGLQLLTTRKVIRQGGKFSKFNRCNSLCFCFEVL